MSNSKPKYTGREFIQDYSFYVHFPGSKLSGEELRRLAGVSSVEQDGYTLTIKKAQAFNEPLLRDGFRGGVNRIDVYCFPTGESTYPVPVRKFEVEYETQMFNFLGLDATSDGHLEEVVVLDGVSIDVEDFQFPESASFLPDGLRDILTRDEKMRTNGFIANMTSSVPSS